MVGTDFKMMGKGFQRYRFGKIFTDVADGFCKCILLFESGNLIKLHFGKNAHEQDLQIRVQNSRLRISLIFLNNFMEDTMNLSESLFCSITAFATSVIPDTPPDLTVDINVCKTYLWRAVLP